MNYRSINDLVLRVRELLPQVPRDVDLVVGIPRSGLLPATVIALALEKPVADLDSFLRGSIARRGATRTPTDV
ncbi:MAG: phosphoribosyltransferase, partial [Thermoanaerobaculia bacterium]